MMWAAIMPESDTELQKKNFMESETCFAVLPWYSMPQILNKF